MLIFVNHDDMRSLELMDELIRRGYYVSDQLNDLRYADVLYLGLKGVDNKNRLMTHQETRILDSKLFKGLKKNCLVITLLKNQYLLDMSKEYHFRYIDLLSQEDFLNKNSILTAEGLISYLISHRRNPLYKSKIMVLGFGHCAKPIIQYLKAFDSNIDVAIRNMDYKEEVEKMGANCIDIQSVDLSQYEILINTIPSVVIDKEQLDKANKRIMIVDIASYPYGINHHYAISIGLNSIILPSIPCKYAYGYAGKMVADVIERELENV